MLKGAPEAAQFTWRATSQWQNGVHTQVKVQPFFGLGEEQSHKAEHVFDADHPAVFAAEDNGITPIEYLLVGLASCLSAGVASVAQNRGIQLRSVEATVEGNHDIRGILGADSDVRNGFNDITVKFKIDADATPAGDRGARRAVAEALGGLRRAHQPDRCDRRGCLSAPSSSALRPSSSAPATRDWRPATSSPSARSTTSSSSAGRWRTPGGASAGTRCGCSRPTG